MSRIRPTVLATVAAVAALAPAASAATTKVTDKTVIDQAHWGTADTRSPGRLAFVNGPLRPPLGVGSAEMRTPDNPSKVQLFTDLFEGTTLASIRAISYSTLRSAAPTGSPATAALNIAVDLDNSGTFDGTLVYEPYMNGGDPGANVWKTWDAYAGGNGKWWYTKAGTAANPIAALNACGQATPCAFSTYQSAAPFARVRGGLGLNQGTFNAGVVSYVDNLTINTTSSASTFDLDPTCETSNGLYETGVLSSIILGVRNIFSPLAPEYGLNPALQGINDSLLNINCRTIVPLGL